jgi:hypothetical protein
MDKNLDFLHSKITIKSSSKYMTKDCHKVQEMMSTLGIKCNITPFKGKGDKNGCEIEYHSALGIPARRSVEHVYNEMQYNFLPMDTHIDITLNWKGCIKKLFHKDK